MKSVYTKYPLYDVFYIFLKMAYSFVIYNEVKRHGHG